MNLKVFMAAILTGLLGVAGNWYNIELFFNVNFVFGSFFAMLAMLRFGRLAGVIAGVISAVSTYFLWNHPWAVITFSTEILFVSWRMKKTGRDILIQDILFWLLGLPLMWVLYHQVMGMPIQPLLMLFLKNAINGIFNTLLATGAIILWQVFSRDRRVLPTFRQTIFTTTVLLILFPAILLIILSLRAYADNEKGQLAEFTSRTATIARETVNQWVRATHKTVIGLASLVGDPEAMPRATMQNLVEAIKEASPQFVRLAVLDRVAITVAMAPLLDGQGRSTVGRDFSDRPYIPWLKANQRPLVGEMVMGRIDHPAPSLPFLAPLVVDGEYRGYCAGIVEQTQLKKILSAVTGPSQVDIILRDQKNQIISSTRPDLKTMSRFTPPVQGIEVPMAADVRHWVPDLEPGISIMQRWRTSFFVTEFRLSEDIGWTIRVETSLVPLLDDLHDWTLKAFLTMFLLILFMVGLSDLLSNALVSSLLRLREATERLPQRLAVPEPDQDWPVSRINELEGLISNFKQMAQALKLAFQEQRQLNERLEQRVIDRTSALLSANEQLLNEISDRQQVEIHLSRALQEKEVLLKEVHHRVKNNLQVVMSLLNMQTRQVEDELVKRTLQDSRDRVRAMALIHETLHRSTSLAEVSLREYTKNLMHSLFQAWKGQGKTVQTSLDIGDIKLPLEQAVPCGLILNELITNVLKYAILKDGPGFLGIEAKLLDPGEVELVVRDHGPGLPDDLDRLIGKSLGLNLVSILVKDQLLGSLRTMHDAGAVFIIRWPYSEKARREKVSG